MVTRVFTDAEIEFLGELAKKGADAPTMIGSFRARYPHNSVDDDRLKIKYGVVRRALVTNRTYCNVCGAQIYSGTKCPGC